MPVSTSCPAVKTQLLNPGGTADLRMDMGLYLWDFNKVRLAGVQSLTLCGEHHPCLLVRGLDGKISHVNGTEKSLLPAEDARPVCALSKFRPGMLMKDACALLEKDPLRDDGGAVLTSLGFADMVWAARLTPYTPGDDNVEAFPVKAGGEVLEHVELRQKLQRPAPGRPAGQPLQHGLPPLAGRAAGPGHEFHRDARG